jgi:hypothetical protein
MVDVKEIKHIKMAPFTLMSSSIQAVLAFIAAILFVLTFGLIAALIPSLGFFAGFIALLGLSIIILWPLSAFFYNILFAFTISLIYNLIAPRVGGIKLGMEGDTVKSIPVVGLALIVACIMLVLWFLVGLFIGLGGGAVISMIRGIFSLLGAVIPVVTNATAANATNLTGAGATAVGTGTSVFGFMWSLTWIIIMPIAMFIVGFIGYALFAIFYNVLIPKVGGMQLKFAPVADNVFELTNIPTVPTALALAVVFAIFGAIYGLFTGAMSDVVTAIIALIVNAIVWFILYFIIVALATLVYNYLQPKIGGIKLELE